MYEVIYWKSVSMIIYNYLYITSFGLTIIDIPKNYRKVMLCRGFVGFFGLQGYWASLKYMPISLASCICVTTPIPLAILAQVILGEKMSKYDIISIISAFCGVIIINNPFKTDSI